MLLTVPAPSATRRYSSASGFFIILFALGSVFTLSSKEAAAIPTYSTSITDLAAQCQTADFRNFPCFRISTNIALEVGDPVLTDIHFVFSIPVAAYPSGASNQNLLTVIDEKVPKWSLTLPGANEIKFVRTDAGVNPPVNNEAVSFEATGPDKPGDTILWVLPDFPFTFTEYLTTTDDKEIAGSRKHFKVTSADGLQRIPEPSTAAIVLLGFGILSFFSSGRRSRCDGHVPENV